MYRKIVALSALCLLVGCSSRGITKPRSELIEEASSKGIPVSSVEEDKTLFFQVESENQERLVSLLRSRVSSGSGDNSYLVGPNDDVEVSVFDVPELNVTVKVKGSGYLDLPLIGAVQAIGKTEAALLDEIRKRLRSYVRNPQVNVFVSHYGSQKIAVLGAVRKPGTYSLKKGSNSIIELLGFAGGVSDKAGNFVNFIPAENNPVIKTMDDAEARARLSLAASQGASTNKDRGLELYLDQVLGTNGGVPLDIPVRAGDMIIVPEGGKVMVEGEVDKPGSIELGQQMTLLSALAATGGITYSAKVDEVEVVRNIGEKKVHLVMDLEQLARGEGRDVRLRNGDIVRVPSDSGKRLKQDTFESITKVFNFGVGGSVPLN